MWIPSYKGIIGDIADHTAKMTARTALKKKFGLDLLRHFDSLGCVEANALWPFLVNIRGE